MKSSIIVVDVLFCLTAYVAHAEVGDRHSEKAGSFSLQAPKGWKFHEFPGIKYKIALGPALNSFSPIDNI
jgi:hypothetical protein